MVTSSAVVGSSAIRKSGSQASVIAIITRCFCPPEAERVFVDAALGLGDADARRSHSIALARAARRADRCGSRSPRRSGRPAHHRVQAGGRLLEDHADAPAAHRAHARFGQGQHVVALDLDAALFDVAVLGQQAHQRQRRHALAAAGFAHQREGLAAPDGQALRPSMARTRPASASAPTSRFVDCQHRAALRHCAAAGAGAGCARAGRRRRARRRRTGWPPAPAPP